MAAPGYVDTILNALDAAIRVPLTNAFNYAMRDNALGANVKAENFSWFKVSSTTHATANTEFSVLHGMDHAPTKLIPMLRLDSTGQQLVPLVCARVADAKRVYLKSSSTSAQFIAFLE